MKARKNYWKEYYNKAVWKEYIDWVVEKYFPEFAGYSFFLLDRLSIVLEKASYKGFPRSLLLFVLWKKYDLSFRGNKPPLLAFGREYVFARQKSS